MGWFTRTKSTPPSSPPPPPPMRTERMRDALTGGDVAMPEPNVFRNALRTQLFGRAYVEGLGIQRGNIVLRAFADAYLVLTRDHGGGESTVSADDLVADGISREAAFLLGRKLGVRDTAREVSSIELPIAPGARTTMLAANSFYLSAVVLEALAIAETAAARIVCPITWHHWLVAELEPPGVATRDTLRALQRLADTAASGAKVTMAETIGTSLWWWPVGLFEPVPFTADGKLPAGLAALVR